MPMEFHPLPAIWVGLLWVVVYSLHCGLEATTNQLAARQFCRKGFRNVPALTNVGPASLQSGASCVVPVHTGTHLPGVSLSRAYECRVW